MTALLVVDVPPPTPSTWRGSGLPNTRRSTSSLDQPGTSSLSRWKTQHLLVPPRIQVAAMSAISTPLGPICEGSSAVNTAQVLPWDSDSTSTGFFTYM